MYDLIDKEMDFRGIFRYANTYKLAVELESNGQTDLQKLITHTFPVDDIKNAMEMALCNLGTKDVMKVVVRF